MNIAPRLPRESARDYALRVLRENIITLRLEPGSMVSENELAVQLGLSRTPVREALIEMSKTGIVEVFPQRGSMISKIDYDLVEEARFVRFVLENAVVELACEQATAEDHARLAENIHLQEYYLEHYAPDKLLELDNQFHKLLFAASKKSLSSQILDGLTTHFDRVRHMSLSTVSGRSLLEEHSSIAAAVQARDKEKARALMTKHLTRYTIDKEAIQKQYPQYFKE